MWDAQSVEAVTPPLKHEDWGYQVSFSQDNSRLVTTTKNWLRWYQLQQDNAGRLQAKLIAA